MENYVLPVTINEDNMTTLVNTVLANPKILATVTKNLMTDSVFCDLIVTAVNDHGITASDVMETLDMSEIASEIDLGSLACEFRPSDIAAELDADSIAKELDMDELVACIDYKALSRALIGELKGNY